MEVILGLLAKYGIEFVCVAYLIYFQNTTMKNMLDEFKGMNTRLTRIETKLDIEEDEKK